MNRTEELIAAKGGIDEALAFCLGEIELYRANGWLDSVIEMWQGHADILTEMK